MATLFESTRQRIRNSGGLKFMADEALIDANLLQKQIKVEKIAIFSQIKMDNPKMTNKEICEHMGLSETTMRRIRKDLNVSSPFRYELAMRKSTPKKSNEAEKPKTASATSTAAGRGRKKSTRGRSVSKNYGGTELEELADQVYREMNS